MTRPPLTSQKRATKRVDPDSERGLSSSSTAAGLPLPQFRRHRRTGAFHTVRPIDSNACVHAQGIVDLLGWSPGDRLRWQFQSGLVVVTRPVHAATVPPGETTAITSKGYFRIPSRARLAARLGIGDRVLVTGGLARGIVVVFPMLALDEALLTHIATSLGEQLS
ncbi:hypothetical protein [Nocardia sp. CA-119907]|uniref:hypothetical protein n=1 Tax=Nocardia sp. CA-119907 TaxID=3239973 RepID=UPI003D9593E0